MHASVDDRPQPVRLAVVVPFHRNLSHLRQCLTAIGQAATALPVGVTLSDLLVVADGAIDDPAALAARIGARVLEITGPRGPAAARTRGAETVSGDVVVFVDADVVVRDDALARLGALFAEQRDLGAAFGAYDEHPADPGFFSQCRNLAHSFIHQRSNRDAHTFWAGLGGVRAPVFAAVGGFDERFRHPSVEDIDLGYRIRAAGFRIALDPAIQGTHLKRWTFLSSVVSDVRDRGIPWTQLLSRYRGLRDDLNVSITYRLCVVFAYLLVICLMGAFWQPELLAFIPVGIAALWFLDRPYYRFFTTRRGVWFTLAWFPFHILHHLCNGFSFIVGNILYASQRHAGVVLPGSIPLSPWTASPASDGNRAQPFVRS